MNKIRRKSLQELLEVLYNIRENLYTVNEEETECRDNIPENLQGTDRYMSVETSCDNLEEALSYLDEVIQNIETSIE